jgi:D-tyrosyl-tRNA(Tyr) deacylase
VIALVQRVRQARVEVAGEVTAPSARAAGAGVRRAADTEAQARAGRQAAEAAHLRDDAGKMNRSVQDIGGGLLVVSSSRWRPTPGRQPAQLHRRRAGRAGRALYEAVLALARVRARAGGGRRVRRRHAGAPGQRRAGDDPDARGMKKAARGRPCRDSAEPSVRVLAGGLDGRAPLVDLGLDELLVLGRGQAAVGDDHGAQGFLALDELGVLQRRRSAG